METSVEEMIEQQIIDGRPATVAYINGDFTPAGKSAPALVKVLFDDGEVVFLATGGGGADAESGDEAATFNRHRGQYISADERAHRLETQAESDAWLRHRAKQIPAKVLRTPTVLGRSYAQWAKILLADDLSRIDNAIRIGLTEGFDNAEIARKVVGSISLNGVDGTTEITRQRIARLGYAAIKPPNHRKRGTSQ